MIFPENSRETVSVSTICDEYCSQPDSCDQALTVSCIVTGSLHGSELWNLLLRAWFVCKIVRVNLISPRVLKINVTNAVCS